MYLLNQIAQTSSAKSPIASADCSLLERVASHLLFTDTRYVLMEDLAEVCQQLVFDQPDLLADCFDLIRLPSPVVWLEWCQADANRSRPGRQRVGLLIRSAEGGRKGTIQVVWENPGGTPIPEPARMFFDFDGCSDEFPDFALHHSECDLSEVLKHFWIDPACKSIGRTRIVRIAQDIWLTGPFIAAFCLLQSFRDEIEHREKNPARLNAQRQKQGKPPLLSHVEVHDRLFSPSSRSGERGAGSANGAHETRLHHVRGHFVRRGNRVFWRRPHLRGNRLLGEVCQTTRVLSV